MKPCTVICNRVFCSCASTRWCVFKYYSSESSDHRSWHRPSKSRNKDSDTDASSESSDHRSRRRPSLSADIYTRKKSRGRQRSSDGGSGDDYRSRDNPHSSGDYLDNMMDNANKCFFDYSYQGGVPILQLKPEVTKELLRLYGTPPGIHDMIDFFGRFEDELQKSHHPLKLATYIGENYRASLERLIKENKRGYALEMYTKVGSSGFILQGGKQVLSNKEVAELMRRSVMPKSSMQMMAILNTSVYPHSHWKFFESEENIRKNMRTYYQLWLTYLRNWDILLDLLSPASKYLPRYVMSQKRVKGLVEYLMEGAPNKEYAKHIFQRGVSEADRTDNLTWKRYNELYLVALDEAVKATEKVKD